MTGPIGVGVIGAGSCLGEYLVVLDRLVSAGKALEGPICARRKEVWPALLERRPAARLVTDPVDVARADVGVIVVITRDDSHADYVRLGLEHGKHVVVERPIAMTLDEARDLAQVARDRGLHLISGPVVHLSPTFRALWARIRDGAIGRVHAARGLFGGSGFTWAPWLHQVDSGGIFGQVGAYHVKSLTSLLGPVAEVAASVENTVLKPRVVGGVTVEDPVSDLSVVTLRHEGGALSSVIASSVLQRYRRPAALELYGTEGTANFLGEDSGSDRVRAVAQRGRLLGGLRHSRPHLVVVRRPSRSRRGAARSPGAAREPRAGPPHPRRRRGGSTGCHRAERAVPVESRFEPLDLEPPGA